MRKIRKGGWKKNRKICVMLQSNKHLFFLKNVFSHQFQIIVVDYDDDDDRQWSDDGNINISIENEDKMEKKSWQFCFPI